MSIRYRSKIMMLWPFPQQLMHDWHGRTNRLIRPLAEAMVANCHVSSVFASNLKTSGGLTAEQLARNWMIPIAKARRPTMEMTTQRGIRTRRPGELIRQFKTND